MLLLYIYVFHLKESSGNCLFLPFFFSLVYDVLFSSLSILMRPNDAVMTAGFMFLFPALFLNPLPPSPALIVRFFPLLRNFDRTQYYLFFFFSGAI